MMDEETEISRFHRTDASHKPDWTLEFVKSVCYVLGLNKSTQQQVTTLKRVSGNKNQGKQKK